MGAPPKGNIYAELARLKKRDEEQVKPMLREATEVMAQAARRIQDLEEVATQREQQMTVLRKDNINMQKALAQMATANPGLYEQVAQQFNLM